MEPSRVDPLRFRAKRSPAHSLLCPIEHYQRQRQQRQQRQPQRWATSARDVVRNFFNSRTFLVVFFVVAVVIDFSFQDIGDASLENVSSILSTEKLQ